MQSSIQDQCKRALIPVLQPDKLDAEGLEFYLKETNNVLPYLFDGAPEHAKIRGRHTKPALRE